MAATVLVVDNESPIVEIIQDILESRDTGFWPPATPSAPSPCWTRILAPSTSCSPTSRCPFTSAGPSSPSECNTWPDFQVIFMTRLARETLPEGALPPNARVLLKPITLEALLSAVSTALGP